MYRVATNQYNNKKWQPNRNMGKIPEGKKEGEGGIKR